MSASRCLGPAIDALKRVPRLEWKAYIDALPAVCPRSDCTGTVGCRAHVGDYFRVQWHAQARLQRQGTRCANAKG